jgi:hypothetical protein
MSWERTERTLADLQERLASAQTPEQCQAIGQLARDSLISLAQSVFRADIHWRTDEPIPSPTDSKRQLDAYVGFVLAGKSNEEARGFLRAAVQLADALTHKRTATPKDAKLCSIATEALIRFVATLEDHELSNSRVEWQGVEIRGRYFAWDGPKLHALDDRPPIPAPLEAIEAIRNAGHKPVFGLREKLYKHQATGAQQVFETDRRSWRRELLQTSDGQLLLVRPNVDDRQR